MTNSHKHPVETLAFSEAPCLCVQRHTPHPLEIELHHVFPQEFQKKAFAGKVPDQTKVALCDIAHKNIHHALNKMLQGDEGFRLGNEYQQGIAREGLRRIREAGL